jgi:two-component system sensor histidine kinase PhoQ
VTRLPRSLAGRLLIAALVLMPVALGLTGFYLEKAHREALDAAIAERLQLQVVTLLALADVDDGFALPLMPLESRLLQPASGLYAMVSGARGDVLWVSPSAAFLADPLVSLAGGIPVLAPGEGHDSERNGLLRHAYQVLWELDDGAKRPLRFIVAESAAPRDADVAAFRNRLLLWLAGTVLVMLLLQLVIVRFGLQPLRDLAERISRIERGEAADVEGDWPREVRPLVDNLDALLAGEQQRRERTRNTLADLAHSLKTPLAVLRSADLSAPDYRQLIREQLDRMDEVMQWHLQRAVGGNHRLLQRIAVAPVLERLRATLLKVYAARELDIAMDVEATARYRGDERDLLEILGNLLDNACKYARGQVRVTARGGDVGEGLAIAIEDDGEGISPELRDALLRRGSRADSRQEGQGIGLAVVLDIVTSHGGQLTIGDSELGGAAVRLTFP